ncbi:MAG: PAS domain S-box protein, partial [Desulfobulbaceae bacterium]
EKVRELELYRLIFANSTEAVAIVDRAGCVLRQNPAQHQLLGYSEEELKGKSPSLYLDEKTNAAIIAALAGRSTAEGEGTAICKRGQRVFVDYAVFPLFDVNNGPSGYVWVLRDVSERKKAEAQLFQARQEWDRTFDAISDVVTVQDLDMRIIQANTAARDLFQLPLEQIIGKKCYELFREPGAGECPECPIPHARKIFMPHMAEIENPLLGKTFQVTVVPIIDDQGAIKDLVHFAKDVTEKKNLTAQLLQSQKLEAVGKLAGGVAHDFNNLLSIILGYTEIALKRFAPSEPVVEELQQVEIAGKKAANLVRQLLLFGRKHQLKFTAIDLSQAIDELLKMLHRVLGEDVRLTIDLADDCWRIEGDAGNIDQVVMNLAVNARDAMPEGGALSIKTENMVIDEHYCEHHSEALSGSFVCLSVSDTGEGMSEELLGHIFEPFYTTKEVGKGTGLGLSVVYGIVKSHKGWVTVYSEPGQGTTFRLYFPAVSAAASEAAKNIPDPGLLLGHGERILVVEDDDMILELELSALSRNGYVVTGAASAEDGLARFAEQPAAFDLVLSDVVLPGMNGVDFVEKLREAQPDLCVLLCSGYADQKAHWPIIQERGYAFLEKPFTIVKIYEAVRDALAKARS